MPTVDPQLIAAARAQDFHAWDRLLKEHQLPLYTYVAELIRDDTAALDIIQETFAAAVRHVHSLRESHRFSSWLFGIAHQKCIQHWRRTRKIEVHFSDPIESPDDHPDDSIVSPLDQLLRREHADALFTLVEKLPPPQRSVFLLHVIEDFSLEEIAQITTAPLGTVKSRLHHARRALRQLISSHENVP